ncbi:MAG: LysR family transcriptional regulator ArgP [Comamonas sp.]
MSNLDPVALECLAAIVEEGGFEKAALRLHVTQSAVSQRLRALEAQVGSVLVVRSRPLKATPAGQRLLKHVKQLRLLRADLERDLQELAPLAHGDQDNERISIAINADSIATWAPPALHELAVQRLSLEVIADDQDFTQDWLRSGEVLGCVTTMSQALRGCRMVPLGAMHYVAVAAADYAARHVPEGLSRGNFRELPFLSYNRKDDMQDVFVARAMGLPRVDLQHIYLPSSEGQLRAVAAGWGLGVVPELLARPGLADGSLVNVAPGQVLAVDLYWHCWNLQSGLLEALTEAMLRTARASLEPSQLQPA